MPEGKTHILMLIIEKNSRLSFVTVVEIDYSDSISQCLFVFRH